ncbi:ATP-grasp domain-containing protein [Sphingomonas sp. Leaf242]|uniref:ATP-grasp domain-containing protein n=1 Tax=Sphingomonas sp. Leaf242 TaxID=1736304 RepID=UPI0009E83CDF|nr:ATP-grasp domain-containing protein [Sphingomonas sp. Leaf242]
MIVYTLSSRAAVIEAAKKAGVVVVPVGPQSILEKLPLTERYIEVSDQLNPLQVTRALIADGVKHGDPECICIGLGDDTSQVAALVNVGLSLGNNRFASFTSLELMRDKLALRARLGVESSLNGRFERVENKHQIRHLLKEFPKGIVLKPLDGSGSRGVVIIKDESEIPDMNPNIVLLLEEYFCGPEFSVETISWNGKHHPLVVTAKKLGGSTGVVEVGQRQPAYISGVETAKLFSAAEIVLNAADYQYGLSHIEFILQDGEPRLVEAHGRVGGDRISDLMHWTIGMSAFEILFRSYNNNVVPSTNPSGLEAAITFFDLSIWQDTDSAWKKQIAKIKDVKEVEILRNIGDRLDVRSSADRHAHVVLAGTSLNYPLRQLKTYGSLL